MTIALRCRVLSCACCITGAAAGMGSSATAEGQLSPATHTVPNAESAAEVPAIMRWEPRWREQGDCGPVCLFLLMRILDKQVTLHEVKRHIPFDAKQGCSVQSIQDAAQELGLPIDVRFVNPRELGKIPCPFILHGISSIEKNRGHFILVVDYAPEEHSYRGIDIETESLAWGSEAALLNTYSGYALVPKRQLAQRWTPWAGWAFVVAVGAFLFLYSDRFFPGRRDACARGRSGAGDE